MRKFLGALIVSVKRGNPRKVSYTQHATLSDADRQARSHKYHGRQWRFAYRINVYAKSINHVSPDA